MVRVTRNSTPLQTRNGISVPRNSELHRAIGRPPDDDVMCYCSLSGDGSHFFAAGLGALGVFSSSSTEVASHLMSAGGSAWCAASQNCFANSMSQTAYS